MKWDLVREPRDPKDDRTAEPRSDGRLPVPIRRSAVIRSFSDASRKTYGNMGFPPETCGQRPHIVDSHGERRRAVVAALDWRKQQGSGYSQ